MSVVMTATPSGPDPQHINWKLCNLTTNVCGTGTQTEPYPAIYLSYNSGPQDVIFVINDPSNLGIKFANDPLWMVMNQGQHPTGPGIHSNGQLGTPQKFSSVLIVPDHNSQAQWMSYRLNFVDKANQPVKAIDPDWHNGGTGSGLSFYLSDQVFVASVAGALVLGLLIGMWIGRVVMRSQSRKSGTIG